MKTTKKEEKRTEEDLVIEKLEEMDNKLERIKSDTHSLNRVTCINYSNIIIKELWKVVGNSEIRAEILHLTKDEIGFGELVQALGIKKENLSINMKPFLGNKGFIAELKKGRNKYFQRSEQVDIVGFENEEKFIALLKSWEAKRTKETTTEEGTPPKEKPNAT